MRSLRQDVHLPIAPHAAFALLHSPAAIKAWWSATAVVVAPRQGGIHVAAWGPEDGPDYVTVARILIWDPPHRLRLGRFEYVTRDSGLPFEAEIETEFVVEPADDGCQLVVVQEGFPDSTVADAFFQACRRGWLATLDGIRRYADRQVS